jgi:hypothetical protein
MGLEMSLLVIDALVGDEQAQDPSIMVACLGKRIGMAG